MRILIAHVRYLEPGGEDVVARSEATLLRAAGHEVEYLALDTADLRRLPLSMRKANLARLLRGRPEGIFLSPFEQGEIGPDLFRKACEFGLEGLVSKHRDKPYRGGRQKHWINSRR